MAWQKLRFKYEYALTSTQLVFSIIVVDHFLDW